MQRQKIRTPRAHISFACPLWVLPWSPMRDEAITYVKQRILSSQYSPHDTSYTVTARRSGLNRFPQHASLFGPFYQCT